MITFCIGLIILVVGAVIYGRVCEKIVKPTDAPTPATTKYDGIDYVPMKKWKNCLIELLNIAGTGPILGPIQGVLFGPIAFITIPIGCVIGGAVHDYFCGMISVRNDGKQMPALIGQFFGKYYHAIYNVFVCVIMVLVATVFVYMPGDLFVVEILKGESKLSNPAVWIVYGVIFVYFAIATLLPIDKIIGKIYPVFGAILLLSALGIFIGLFAKGYHLQEIWEGGLTFLNPYGEHFIPIFFVTVACGIVSGFHSTQATIISRTIEHEKEGRVTFYDMMILEGFIAMVWAAAAMGAVEAGLATNDMLRNTPTNVVAIIANHMLGRVGGLIAVIGVIVLPITSGDTALRSLRMVIMETFKLDSSKKRNNMIVALCLFCIVGGILFFAKANAEGFNILWRYFAWGNETIAVFAFSLITVYMIRHKMPFIVALIPGMFYNFVVVSYILNAKIGFNLPWTVAYIVAGILTVIYGVCIVVDGIRDPGKGKPIRIFKKEVKGK